MQVTGIADYVLYNILQSLDMEWRDAHYLQSPGIGPRTMEFKLRAINQETYYSRRSFAGAKCRIPCVHGWRDFIRVCFANGATKVKTVLGTWRTVAEFDSSLPSILEKSQNVVALCTHRGPLPALLRRAVQLGRSQAKRAESVIHAL